MRAGLSAFGFGLSAWVALCSCGYSFSHGGKLPKAGGSLRIGKIDNRTALPEAAGLVESSFKDELIARGQLGGEAAPLEASLEVLAVRSTPNALFVGGAFAFHLDASDDYLAGVDVLGTEANRRAALRRVSRFIAREALDRMAVAGRFAK